MDEPEESILRSANFGAPGQQVTTPQRRHVVGIPRSQALTEDVSDKVRQGSRLLRFGLGLG